MKVYSLEKNNSPAGDAGVSKDYFSAKKKILKLVQFLDKRLVGKSNAADFSMQWRQKFSHHPSWCDADMCLQQINLGNAMGNRVALYSRSFFQRLLFIMGDFVQRWPKFIIFMAFIVLSICFIGLKDVTIETDLVKLWVQQGGRLDEELAFFGQARAKYYTKHRTKRSANSPEAIKPQMVRRPPPEIPMDAGLNGGFQVVIQTPEVDGTNVLTKDSLLRHVQVLEEIAQYEVEMFGETWSLADICFKPPAPKVPKNNVLASYQHIFDKLIPCIWITPVDCFWDASKALGPYPTFDVAAHASFLPHLPKGNLSWRTLDPQLLLEDLSVYREIVGGVTDTLNSLFDRAGVGHAYQQRVCIDPLDSECPKTAPNYFDRCDAYRRFLTWNERRPTDERVQLKAEEPSRVNTVEVEIDLEKLLGRRRKRQASQKQKGSVLSATTAPFSMSTSDDYYEDAIDDVKTTTDSSEINEQRKFNKTCELYAKSFLQWMNEVGPSNWQFLDEPLDGKQDDSIVKKNKNNNYPKYPNYGDELTNGCKGFGQNIMNWPEDLIVGGVKRRNGIIISAEAFQSVFLVAAAADVYQRFKHKDDKVKPNLDKAHFTAGHAGAIIASWQRNFTDRLYKHPLNNRQMLKHELISRINHDHRGTKENHNLNDHNHQGQYVGMVVDEEAIREEQERVIHPLASTSIQDMLKEFSEFQFGIIITGYLLMVLYAGYTQLDWDGWWFSIRSNCFLAIVGVLIITYASIAGLGLSAFMGIHFNAATTQIVPFLTLGLGIDDMFLFLHNYNGVLESVKKREVAILVKETGMSILITSSNNILAFLAGIILPIPALRSFCVQTAILLTFNLISITVIFPAFVTIDLRRRKNGIRDMTCGGCCLSSRTSTIVEAQKVKQKLQESESRNKLVRNPSCPSMSDSAHNHHLQPQSSVILALNKRDECYHLPENDADGGAVDRGVLKSRTLYWSRYSLERFLHEFYIPFLSRQWVKTAVIALSAGLFTFGCIGLRDSVLGLELADVLPESTPPAAFLRAREKYFSFYPMFVVLKDGVDYPRQQDTIEQLRLDIGRSNFVIKGDTILRHVQEPSEHHWIWFMREWLRSLQRSFDEALLTGNAIDLRSGQLLNASLVDDQAGIARRLLCSHGETFNCSGRMDIRLVDANGLINPDGFYNYLTAWYNIDNMMYYVSQGQIFPPPPPWIYNAKDVNMNVPPAEPIIFSQIPFFLTGLTDTPVIVDMIKEVRSICDHYTKDGLPVFPTGIPFTFWEQYLHLTTYLLMAIIIIGVTVLLVISVIIFNLWAAAMVAVVVVSMTVELGGFMGLFGVKMNPISAVTLITAVGIGVEFTAHVVLAFLTSLGTREERMNACLEHMFIPVVHGVLSTLLGIVMLAFSEFDFVFKYFFVVMSVLILLGMFNGLAMLPVMLSLVGPPCEVYPTDGGNVLACPMPLGVDDKKQLGGTDSDGDALTVFGRRSGNAVRQNTLPPKRADIVPANNKETAARMKQSSNSGTSSPSPPTSESSVDGGCAHVYHESLTTLHEESDDQRCDGTTPHSDASSQNPTFITSPTSNGGEKHKSKSAEIRAKGEEVETDIDSVEGEGSGCRKSSSGSAGVQRF